MNVAPYGAGGFCVARSQPGAVKLVPLAGRVRLDGDCHFEV
jgi:hypothetical protein